MANPGQFEEERTVSIHKVSTVDKEHHSPLGRETSAVVEMRKVGILNMPGTKRAMGLIRHENKITPVFMVTKDTVMGPWVELQYSNIDSTSTSIKI